MTESYPQEPGTSFSGRSLLNAARKSLDDGVDVALFGIPFHGGTFGREGSRHGPEQMRQMSHNIRALNLATRVAPFELCRVADIGDVSVTAVDPPGSLESITAFCKEVCAAGALPLAAGGDHTIALPMLRGVASVNGPVGVVHFDAHPDTMELGDDFGSRYNYATPFRRAVEEGLEDPTRHVMIGIRGTMVNDLEAYEWAEKQGMTILWMDECFELGAKGIVAKIRSVIGDHPTHITVDIDGIDPTDMPGTGSPEPGGLRMIDMQMIFRGMRGMNLVGADINEICPPLDPSGQTALNAAHLMFEMLCLLAERRANG